MAPFVPRKVSKILFSEAVLEADAGVAGALLEVKYLLRRRDMLDGSPEVQKSMGLACCDS